MRIYELVHLLERSLVSWWVLLRSYPSLGWPQKTCLIFNVFSYPTYIQIYPQKINTDIISSSTHWHTFIDTHRHTQSHSQPLIHAETHTFVYSDTYIYMQIYPLSSQSHKGISLSFSYIHTHTDSNTFNWPMVVKQKGYLPWQTEVGIKRVVNNCLGEGSSWVRMGG